MCSLCEEYLEAHPKGVPLGAPEKAGGHGSAAQPPSPIDRRTRRRRAARRDHRRRDRALRE